jgi:hypothetical protein
VEALRQSQQRLVCVYSVDQNKRQVQIQSACPSREFSSTFPEAVLVSTMPTCIRYFFMEFLKSSVCVKKRKDPRVVFVVTNILQEV